MRSWLCPDVALQKALQPVLVCSRGAQMCECCRWASSGLNEPRLGTSKACPVSSEIPPEAECQKQGDMRGQYLYLFQQQQSSQVVEVSAQPQWQHLNVGSEQTPPSTKVRC